MSMTYLGLLSNVQTNMIYKGFEMNPRTHKVLFFAYGRGVITSAQLRQLLSMDYEINGIRGIDFE